MTSPRDDQYEVERRLLALEDMGRVGTWEWDVATDALSCSDETCRLLGVDRAELDPTLDGYLACLHPDDRGHARAAIEQSLCDHTRVSADYRVPCPDGTERWVHCRARPVVDSAGNVSSLIGIAQDVTERKAIEQRLSEQALHDPLTGLPNRSLLIDRLSHAMQRTLRSHHHTAVFFIDLDRFKQVNDTAGHAAGDAVLLAVAQHLREAVRPYDTVARYGGDEFVVVAEELAWPSEAVEVGKRLVRAASRPIPHPKGPWFLSASVGGTVAGAHADPHAVLHHADGAMYRAKQGGGHAIVWAPEPPSMD